MEQMKSGLSRVQKKGLLDLARQTIGGHLNAGSPRPKISKEPPYHEKAATFVTLKISGRLRGCIGNLEPVGSLWESVRDNARSAAFHDHRFSPLSPDEFDRVSVDISILSPPRLLEYEDSSDLISKIRPGVDGVILSDGCRGATFLPQVWGQLQSPELFLGQLCQKAGLEEGAWLEERLEIKVYQVFSFGEGDV